MAEAVGTVRVDLFANLAQWSTGLTKAEGQLKRFGNGVSKLGKGIEKAGQSMSRSLSLPLVAFGGFAIKAASDAQDLQGAFNISFGSMADEANAWAVATGDALGRSTQTIQTTANAFQALFEDIAPTEKAAAQLSMRFTELTADFAAFANVSDEQATKVLTGGLAGAGKALKRLGIDVGEAATEQRAFELGIARVGQELTEQQKTLARSTIIMDGFGKAQGEIARSTNDTEQITRKTREEFNELLVTVGDQLLPAFNEFLKGTSKLISEFTKLDKGTQQVIIGFGAAVAAIGPLTVALGVATKLGGGMIKMIGGTIGVLGKLGIAFTAASKNGDKLGLSLRGLLGWFTLLAPVAYEAGKAIGELFNDTMGKETKLVLFEVAVKNLQKTGLAADEARAAVQAYFDAAAAGKPVTEAQAIALGKTVAAHDNAHKAFRQSIDDAIDESIAMGEASAATAEADKTLKDLIASFGDLGGVAATAEQLQAVRDKIDPINAALRQYREELALAKQAGIDTATAQTALGREFLNSIQGVEGWQYALAKLPPELYNLAAALDRTAGGNLPGFGDAIADMTDIAIEAMSTTIPGIESIADKLLEEMTFAQDVMLEFDPAARFEDQMSRIERAYQDGAISAEVYARAKAAAFADTPEGQAQLDLFEHVTDEFTDAAMGAKSFGDAVKTLFTDILRADVIKPFIQNALGGLFPNVSALAAPTSGFDLGGMLKGAGDIFGSLFGGARDSGGPVYPGMSYRIGSGVQETFTPSVPGRISRDGGAGGSGATIVQNFNGTLPDQHSRRQAARQARLQLAGGG